MSPGRVAVLLSTFNGEKYLSEFLLSLKNQEWEDHTLFVRDDGSLDATLQILAKEQSASNNPISLLPSGDHMGAAKSYFDILSRAGDGFDYYAFSDQDDVWLPGKISSAVCELNKAFPEIPTLYCSRLEVVDEKLNHLRWSGIPRCIGFGNALVENIAIGCTVVMNKSARELILAALPDKCQMHDWWCYLLISCFGRIVFEEKSAIKYRQHSMNAVGGATTVTAVLNRRLSRFFKAEDGVFRFSDQAEEFLNKYRTRIPAGEHTILELVISGKTSFKDRIRLACSREIWRQSRVDDLLLRLLILINRY